MQSLFVKTKDEKTKENLIKAGFQLVSFESNIWTFVNNKNFKFDESKVFFSNTLNF